MEALLLLLPKIYTVLSAIVTAATGILVVFPSPKADGILAKLRSLLDVLSGNIFHNK
jgi:hypothetical protein